MTNNFKKCCRCGSEDKYPICFKCATEYERDLLFQLRNLDVSLEENIYAKDSIGDSKNSYLVVAVFAFLGAVAFFLKIYWLGILLLALTVANSISYAISIRKTGYDRRIVDDITDLNLLERHKKADISAINVARSEILSKIQKRSNMTKIEAEMVDNKFKVV